jgi:Transglutaminase-like superfamily
MNLARGGGHQPHLATEVFSKQYGDCKDKANLMKTMLRVAGIDSYMVAIYGGDRNHVHPEWASPEQFNHAIIAIKVPDDVALPSVINHPKLGRLLIFDPTESETPIGDLPEDEQGSYALICAGK